MVLAKFRAIFVFVALCLMMAGCDKNEYIYGDSSDFAGGSSTDEGSASYTAKLPEGLYVWEYTPAPGQFIGDTTTGGMAECPSTPHEAALWAKERLNSGLFVSLGAFGGYIVVSLGDGISNSNGKDFAIAGNSYCNSGSDTGGSNEPGVVSVMYDRNNNGMPDDEWYELAGCVTLFAETDRNYEVTYYRPTEPKSAIRWTDNRNSEGSVDHVTMLHRQDFYWPAWIEGDKYTLKGTRLKSRTVLNPETKKWDNNPFEYGYADNIGSDCLSDMPGQWTGFDISTAIDTKGNFVIVPRVDFIKVHTAVNDKAGGLGELSTEVLGFRILTK